MACIIQHVLWSLSIANVSLSSVQSTLRSHTLKMSALGVIQQRPQSTVVGAVDSPLDDDILECREALTKDANEAPWPGMQVPMIAQLMQERRHGVFVPGHVVMTEEPVGLCISTLGDERREEPVPAIAKRTCGPGQAP